MRGRFLSLALALVLCLGVLPPVSAAESDFVIENGVLTAYNGPGGSVVIPDGVTTIAANSRTFFNNTAITEVYIPDSVTEIVTPGFYGCANLEKAVLGKGITAIGFNHFAFCPKLREITIPDSVVTIERGAFVGCAGLERIVIPDSVTSIGDNAFVSCTGLTEVTLGKGLTSLGPVFSGCTGLTEVVIPDNIRYLQGTFGGCVNLERVIMADTTSYSGETFSGCNKLPDHLTDYMQQTVEQNGDFRISNGVLTQYSGSERVVTIPDGVIAVGSGAFQNHGEITEVVFPDSVVKIDSGAFYGCTGLIAADLNRVTAVGENAFYGCVKIERLDHYPEETLHENLAANERIAAGWTGADPRRAVSEQGERITALSNQICAGLSSDYARIKAVYDWMTSHITYDYDYYRGRKGEVTIFPEEVLDSRLTVCDGYSRLTQALLQAQGIPALRVVGPAYVGTWEAHAWNLAYADNRWIYMDTTWGIPSGGNSGSANADWFDVTALYLSLSHKGTSSFPAVPVEKVSGFDDVLPTDYCAAPVLWAVEKGIAAGTGAAVFSPDAACTTAQILTFLWRSKGQPEPTIQNPFSDVSSGQYYSKAALWAYEEGLVSGPAFQGDTPCTRSATVTYLWKLAGSPAASPAAFTDVPVTADFAPAVAWAVEKGITSGTGPDTFSPDTVCGRGQIVTFLYRAYK